MAKTFEALMKAEKDRKKLDERQQSPNRHEPSAIESGLKLNFTEEYHRMKQNILSINPELKIKTLLFSSSTQGEGNSSVLINFALTLASGGDSVLLVDTNLRNPSFHHVFGLEIENGLTELFLKKNTLKEIMKKTRFDNLSVITSGTLHSNPFIIFGSNALDSYIDEMKTQADWVLFDSPPINAFNDATTLAPRVDGVVMVVQAEKTRWEVAQNARQRIESGNGKIMGVVLNKRKFYVPKWLYKTL